MKDHELWEMKRVIYKHFMSKIGIVCDAQELSKTVNTMLEHAKNKKSGLVVLGKPLVQVGDDSSDEIFCIIMDDDKGEFVWTKDSTLHDPLRPPRMPRKGH